MTPSACTAPFGMPLAGAGGGPGSTEVSQPTANNAKLATAAQRKIMTSSLVYRGTRD
ncbi:MAG: hypothetical protein HOW73_23635 [Polyangiaceae bacterium]|nr:hypothetical protein [Polyangiaceae bacterium]